MIKNETSEYTQFTMTGGLRGSSELSNGFELKNELLELLELLDAAGVRSCILEHTFFSVSHYGFI